jgi:hypothetical protein
MLVYPFMYSPAASPFRIRAPEAKNRNWSAMTGISSDIVSARTLPTFSDSRRPSSSPCSSTRSAIRSRARLRSPGVASDQFSSYAFLAAATARSTSAADASGTSAITSPLAGLTILRVWPSAASTHSPPTYIL